MSMPGYDVATALWQGARPYQEDTLLVDFHGGMDRGFAILADGMGGHAAGDLASRLVVIDAASHLKFLMHDGEALEKTLHSELTSAIETANDVLKDRAADDNRLHGMGSTFLATVIFEDRLYWASVGDSPLYLWREGQLRQLNEDHSMGPVIDQMAKTGEITAEEAAAHPDRNALTSVLMGRPLKAVDVPKTATVLDPGDVLIQASDGVQYLDEEQISKVVAQGGSSRVIADGLMAALRDLDDPTQDNTSFMVLRLTQGAGMASMPVGDAVTGLSATERAVGTPPAAAPRAPTPSAVERPAGARRWVLPAGGLAAAAVVAGLFFALPGQAPDVELAAVEPEFELTQLETVEPPLPEIVLTEIPAPAADVPAAQPATTAAGTPALDLAAAPPTPVPQGVTGIGTPLFSPAVPLTGGVAATAAPSATTRGGATITGAPRPSLPTAPAAPAEGSAADIREEIIEPIGAAIDPATGVDVIHILGDKYPQGAPGSATAATIQFNGTTPSADGQSSEGLSAPDAPDAPASPGVTPLLPPVSERELRPLERNAAKGAMR